VKRPLPNPDKPEPNRRAFSTRRRGDAEKDAERKTGRTESKQENAEEAENREKARAEESWGQFQNVAKRPSVANLAHGSQEYLASAGEDSTGRAGKLKHALPGLFWWSMLYLAGFLWR
jgi:hypothetical protein